MKREFRILSRSIATAIALSSFQARAVDGIWTSLAATGSFGTTTLWQAGTVAAGIDATADFSTLNITANETITLDGSRTLGTLKFGDATTASNDWILNTGTAGSILTLDVTTGPATIAVVNRTATIGAVLAGTDGISVTNGGGTGGTLILGAANTFSGGLSIAGAVVQLNNNLAAGTDAISLSSASTASRLLVNAGVTIANPINIGTTTNVTGVGVLQQTGTGQSTINGVITISGSPSAGGHFVGGLVVGNELVLGGTINSPTVGLSQRDGRVIYKGSGSVFSSLTVTNAAIVGATNGISTAANVILGGSGNATLDLNGFDQELMAVTLGNSGNAFIGTVALGARTLTLTNNLTTVGTTTVAPHVITGTGAINLGAVNIGFNINDNGAAADLTVAPVISGTAGFAKNGSGTLILNGNVTNTGPLDINSGSVTTNGSIINSALVSVNSGTLIANGSIINPGSVSVNFGALYLYNTVTGTGAITVNGGGTLGGNATIANPVTIQPGSTLLPGTATTSGTLTFGALTFAPGAASINMNIGTGGDLVSASTLVTAGATNLNLNQLGGMLPNGVYPLLKYTGKSPGLSGFTLNPVGHAIATLTDTGSAIALTISGNDRVVWDGTASTAWDPSAIQNWKRKSNALSTNYNESDDVIFQDAPLTSLVDIFADVTPSKVTFLNTTATSYTVTGFGGITGTASLTKSGNGTVILNNPNSYVGPTVLSGGGILELDHDSSGNVVLTGTSGVDVAADTTLKLTRDDGGFNFSRNLTGAGTVIVDPHSASAFGAQSVLLSGNNAGFTGLIRLSPTMAYSDTTGGFRWSQPSVANAGSGSIQVDLGGQFWAAGNTYANPMQISGIGFIETAGGVIVPGAGLGALAGIGAIRFDGNAVLTGPVKLNGNAKIMAYNSTATISGNISSVNPSDQLVVGGGNSGSTLILTGTNSYGPTWINSGSSGTTVANHILQVGNNGTSGTLGTGDVTLWGDTFTSILRLRRSDGYTLRQNIIGSSATSAALAFNRVDIDTTGAGVTLNGKSIDLSDGVNGGTLAIGATVAGGILNIDAGSLVDTGNTYIGNAANLSGTINQTGGTHNIVAQLRVGHFGTETGAYNLSVGSLNIVGAATTTFPFTTGATEQNGGIYIGIDGTGVLNQTGGTISTNFLVLDNRTEGVSGANMATGTDSYTLGNGTLILKNAFGIISRFNSTAVQLNGGIIQAAPGISPNLDSNRISVGGGVTIDTNGNSIFTLYGPLSGTGTITLVGGGVFRTQDGTGTTTTAAGGTMPGGSLGTVAVSISAGSTVQANRTGASIWSGALSGLGALLKLNTGTLTILGNSSAYTGPATVSAGRLNVPSSFASALLSVSDGAALGGEPTVGNVTLGSATGATLFIDPTTAGALTATSLTANGTTTLDFSTAPTGAGPYAALKYTTKTGTGTFTLANAASYRFAPLIVDNGSSINVDVTGTKALAWSGSGGAVWNVNNTTSWTDLASVPDVFFAGDTVTFGDGPAITAITVTSGVSPWKTTVNSATNNYAFTSATNGIAGPGNLEKSGASTLTLTGPNTYSGQTIISGGTVTIAASNSLGNAAFSNTIALSAGARLNLTTALDLGASRGIAVGAGGGVIAMTNAAAQSVTIPGDLSGSGDLTFTSGAAGAPTFILGGNGSAYTGNVTVNPAGGGLPTLRLASNNALTAGTVTIINPTTGATGATTTLELPGSTLGAGVALSLNSLLSGTVSYRTQVTSSGQSTINGPITLNGSSIIQFSPGSGVLTLNGPSTGGADFTGIMFIRGAGNGVINGKITLPTGVFSKTDAGTWTINSTGNTWTSTGVYVGTVKIGATDALATAAPVILGQGDTNTPILDLNGFNQTIGGLSLNPGTGGNKSITNSVAATPSTLTVNQSTDVSIGALGILTGALNLTKTGAGNLTLASANSTFNGNVTVNAGTLTAGAASANAGTNGPLGLTNAAGRTVTVSSGATLAFASNNIFGQGTANAATLPAVVLNGGTLTASRYNVLGNTTLNAASLTQASSDAGSYEGYQFRGNIVVSGSAGSTISSASGKANHLGANTLFDVSDATSSVDADLLVSNPLRDQSGDFGLAAGGLTKSGAGTMEISSPSSYTGATVVTAGTLSISGSISGSAVTVSGGTLAGNGGTVGATSIAAGGTLAPGAGIGTLSISGPLTLAGTASFDIAKTGLSLSSDLASSTGLLTLGGTLRVSATGDTLVAGDVFNLFDAASFASSFTAFNLPALNPAYVWNTSRLAIDGTLSVAVPEPGVSLTLLAGAGALLGLRRRRS